MFAYIKDNEIKISSNTQISESEISNISEYKIIEYSDEIKNPILENGKIIEAPKIETEAEKFARVFQKLKNSENLKSEDTEGVVFDDKAIGDLILERVFEGNPHAQTAMQAKVLSMMITGQLDAENLKEVYAKQDKINEIREFFGLKKI